MPKQKKPTNRFTTSFKEYVCEGDTISVEIKGVLYTAHLERDDDASKPDQRQEGFWPSLNKNDDGYIGDGKTQKDLIAQKRIASRIMNSWLHDEWFYCGIVISASQIVHIKGYVPNEIVLCRSAASLWGIEANYPKKGSNNYLTQVANELLDEAIDYVAELKKQI